MNDLKRTPPHVDAGPRVEALKAYLKNNRGFCRRCGFPVFWVSSVNGKRLAMNFGGDHKKTHVLVPTAKDGEYLENEMTAMPSDRNPTHSCHLDSCKGRNR